jgi:hypothetical protein
MNTKRLTIPLVVAVAVCCGWLCLSPSRAQDSGAEDAKSKLVEAAKQTYMSIAAEYQFGQASVEDMYQWSRRLMEAEINSGDGRRLKAQTDHIDRMNELHKKVAALRANGVKGGSTPDYYATMYYLLEAESLREAALK